jgi:aspartyl-tRNA(Asn)/glutamyl-tRNA(Gln) amidotransferase subunit A
MEAGGAGTDPVLLARDLLRTVRASGRIRRPHGPGFVAMLRETAGVTTAEFLRMRRFDYVQRIHDFMEGFDFLLTPSASVAAFPADRLHPADWPQHAWDWLMWAEFTYPFNWLGSPAASLPCGFTREGLPVGLQIVGRCFDDLGVLQASAAFEEARRGHSFACRSRTEAWCVRMHS